MPRALIRLSVAAGFAYMAYAMCRAPVLPLFARQLGAGPELIGLVAGASTITGVFLKLPAGAISDAIGRRAVLLGATAVFALMPLTYPWTTGLAALILLRFVHGSATALFGPTVSAALSDVAPPSDRGRWLGAYAAIQGTGQAAGPVLGGWLLGRAGFAPTFFAAAAFGIAAWTLLAWSRTLAKTRGALAWRDVRAAIAAVASDGRIVLTSLAQAGQFMLHGMISAFLPIYAVENAGLSPAQTGVLFGTQMLTTILSRPVYGGLSDRVGRRPMIVAGLSTSAAAVALFAANETFVTLLLCSALYGSGLAITNSSSAALITDLSDRSRYGAAHGFFGMVFDIGDAAGPIMGGLIAARFGYQPLFYSASAFVIVLAIVFGLRSRRWRPQPQIDRVTADSI